MISVVNISDKRKIEKFEKNDFGRKGSVKISLAGAVFFVAIFVIFCSAFYLFQVNDLAIKGYAIRDLETKIANLEKDNKKMQIKEMELRSMYSIEKSVLDFNLVSPTEVKYLEVNSNDQIALK
jgi:hypothetical protein